MKDKFLLNPDIIFLNHGSFGACPRKVFDDYQRWQFKIEENPVEFLGRKSAGYLEQSRAVLGEFLGASPADLIYVTNATTGVNTVAHSLHLKPGDEILTTDHEYGACDNTWNFICKATGASYIQVPIELPFQSDKFVDLIWARVTAKTRLIFLSHITSTTALIFPIKEICERARKAGITTFIDGAHAPGQIPLNLEVLGADFYTGNCHKWMFAPKGVGFLYAKRERQTELEARVISWGYSSGPSGHKDFDAYTGSSVLEKRHQWQGTRDISGFLTVPAAVNFIKSLGWPNFNRRCHEQLVMFKNQFCAHTGLPAISDDECFGQMVALPIREVDSLKLKRDLYEKFRIEVPITQHQDKVFVRVSMQIYNTESDLEKLFVALKYLLS